MTTPLVSIITPAYNSASYIEETLASVLAQTFTAFEHIVADDGSTDDTIDVVRRVAGGDPRVVITTTSHGGAAIARNAAFRQARGRFIALLDSDDVWMPNYLSEQLKIAESSGVPGAQYYDKVVLAKGEKQFRSKMDPKPN